MTMMRTKSPIRQMRERYGWRAADLAIFARMSLGGITQVERGELAKLPARLEAALIRLGEDVELMRAQHAEFVAYRRQSLTVPAQRSTN